MSPHSGPPSRLSPCCPSLSWTERKKGQRPLSHHVVSWSPSCPPKPRSPDLEAHSSAHIPCFPHPLFPQPSCRGPAPETSPARLPTAELFEDTDAVLLISASPGPSPGPGRQQLVETEAGSFPEPAFPSLAGLVPSRARPQRQGLPGALWAESVSARGSLEGLHCLSCPTPVLLLPGRASLLSCKASAAPAQSLWFVWDRTPHTNQEMRPHLGPSESLCSWDSRWAWDEHVTPHQIT